MIAQRLSGRQRQHQLMHGLHRPEKRVGSNGIVIANGEDKLRVLVTCRFVVG